MLPIFEDLHNYITLSHRPCFESKQNKTNILTKKKFHQQLLILFIKGLKLYAMPRTNMKCYSVFFSFRYFFLPLPDIL